MVIRASSIGGIPFGNNAGRPANPGTGQPYFNGETQRLELYTGAQYGWQNIVAETPGVTGYTGTLYENTGGTIVITGTNFAAGAIATLVGNDGTEYAATSTTVNNLTQASAVFGPISGSIEPYDIRVTNPSNLYGVYYDILTVNDSPVWQTSAGLLSTISEGQSLSANVLATDEENNTLTYSSLNLPSWISLNSANGSLSGVAPGVSSDTVYSFNITVSDGNNNSTRAFSIRVNSIITWNTNSGSIGDIFDIYRVYSYQLSATALANTLTYSIVSGSLPSGLTLNSTGLISGTANSVVSNTTSSFIIRASDGVTNSDRSFNITVYSPVSQTLSGSGNWTSPITGNIEVELLGAGGGGATGNGEWATAGGGGGYLKVMFPVVSGQSYPYSVGALGAGQTLCNNAYWAISGKGGNTTFSGLTAGGGYGGGAYPSGLGANSSNGGSNITTGSNSISYNHSGQNGGTQGGPNAGGSNGLFFGAGINTYGEGAAATANHTAGNHASGSGNGGGGGASCQTPHRGGGNGSAGILKIRY